MTEEADYKAELTIEVQAGQTLVLEVRAKAQADKPADKPPGEDKPPAGDQTATGSFEVQLKDEGGNPAEGISAVYLVGLQNYTVEVDPETGRGRKDGIAPGTYTLTLSNPG